jgi:4'-phosphopantetheinyl transferase
MNSAEVDCSGVCVRVSACPAAFRAAPGADEVLVWVIDLARPPVDPVELFRDLTAEEQTRALRYMAARPREQFVIGRGLLRRVLGGCLGVGPTAVPIAYLRSGKPVLGEGVALAESSLHFNVTHTEGVAVLALARRRVGVDVEVVRNIADAEGLVGRYFSAAEGAEFRSLPERYRPAAFFRGWTCKEAVIKAAGATVGCLADFDVELHPERPPQVNAIRDPELAGAGWSLAEWQALDGIAAAVAVEGAGRLRVEVPAR